MKRKIIGIFCCMLMISSIMTAIIYTNNIKVKASGGGEQGKETVNLSYEWIWERVKDFSWVVNRTDWSNENNIPKGRCWATAGENYTIKEILEKYMKGDNNPCGLTNYTNLTIGPIPFSFKKYSSKIVIQDYSLTLYNNSILYKDLPYAELFPFGIGVFPDMNTSNRTRFNHEKIKDFSTESEIYPFSGTLIKDYYNVTGDLLNYPDIPLAGMVKYIKSNETLPDDENQTDLVFIFDEEPSCEQKMENMSNALGCILIENTTKAYAFTNASNQSFTIARVNGTNTNFSLMLNELEHGSEFFVDNVANNQILVFSNFSNSSCTDNGEWGIGLIDMHNASSGKQTNDWSWIILLNRFHYWWRGSTCKGFILSGPGDTHIMMHTVHNWGWFHQPFSGYSNRYHFPMFSVNETVGNWLRENISTATVSGCINQTYRRQTTSPGVISHNVVAYRNISHSPGDAIAVLSNRIDGWWSETPGDSGVSGAILLGIAKYMHDNNITAKYNLTFLFTTGEEYGMRGAIHYIDSHPNGTGLREYNFVQWIGFDQLGFNYTESHEKNLTTEIYTKNPFMRRLIWTIANETHYEDRTCNYSLYVNRTPSSGAEDYVWKNNCWNTICFEKDTVWDGWHRTGKNYQEGDSLQYIDPNDVRVISELAWNITRYFLINPNCWFSAKNYEAVDSNGGTIPDSLRATFTVKSVLPSDRVLVNATLYDASTDQPVPATYQELNLTINKTGVEHSVTFSMPSGVQEGDYYMKLEVYNSTARINRTLGLTNHSNDTEISPVFHLNRYHTLGDIRIGTLSKEVNNIIRGSRFTPTENAMVWNITAYVSGGYNPAPTYQCLIYRVSDGQLMGASNQAYAGTAEWKTFTFSPKPILLNNTEYMLCIWGNSQNAYVNATPTSYVNDYQNSSCVFGNPPQHITWDWVAGLNQLSIFCRYTLNLPPEIINVSNSPDTVGFGYNVTINANVTDDYNNTLVKVNITYPDQSYGNYTMSHNTGNHYRYVFSNTWTVGQYNYSVWAIDNASNVDSSTGYHFHVSAYATISVATLKDSYSGTQFINITDPPNPPENYTLIGRGLTWNNYYDASSGDNILEAYQGSVNYQENNGSWTPINNSFYLLPNNHPAYGFGYRAGNTHGLFGVYFKPDISSTWSVAFAYNRSSNTTTDVIRSKLVGVGYLDPQSNWAYHYLQSVQSSQGQMNDNTITYPGVFTGTDVSWSYTNTGLKEAITLSNTTKTLLQTHPPSLYGLYDASSYLVFITKLDYQNLNVCNASGLLTGNVTINDTGVDFKDVLEQFKCGLPLGEAWEMNNESVRERLTYRLVHLNGDTYLLSGVRVSDLNSMVFPVVIDPTLTVYSTSSDGYVYNSGTTYSTVRAASSGTVSSSETFITIGQKKVQTIPSPTYYVYRGFVFFNTSSIPSNAYLDNATLSFYKKDDYSTTDFNITIQNGMPTYPHDPMQSGDYNMNDYSGNGGIYNTSGLHNGFNNMTLTNLSWITRNGMTKLCLRSSRDINAKTPTGTEYVNVYSHDMGLGYLPKLVIHHRNQSKIKNTGLLNIKGYLLLQVQFYSTLQGKWIVENDTINETSPRTITSGSQLALDSIFNGHVRASDLTHGAGTYRVYAAFRDPSGNVLKTSSSVELKAWWQFSKTQ